MAICYKVRTLRTGSSVSKQPLDRIESADGSRWAIKTARKISRGNGTYDIVESWRLKERRDGKVVTVHGDAYEDHACEFVGVSA